MIKRRKNRFISIFLVMTVCFLCFSGCGKKEIPPEEAVDILLITDIGTVLDGSYNEGTWNGISQYATDHGLIAAYYEPADTSEEAYLNEIKKGVECGAQVIVCPGYLMETVVYKAQKQYKNISFILIDGIPHDENYEDEFVGENTESILFEEEEAGFLAGYAAVRDGYTNLAFMGGIPEDPVIRYGYGFVQGADYASIQTGIPVSVRYTYTNTYYEDDAVESTAASWYESGTEVIFACGGEMGRSVMRAAQMHDGKVIGVDVDQSRESETVITSAMKSLDSAVYRGLEEYYAGAFRGGETVTLSAAENGVCLPMESSKFNVFNESEYLDIYQQLIDGLIDPYAQTDIGTCEELSLINTEVLYIVP